MQQGMQAEQVKGALGGWSDADGNERRKQSVACTCVLGRVSGPSDTDGRPSTIITDGWHRNNTTANIGVVRVSLAWPISHFDYNTE